MPHIAARVDVWPLQGDGDTVEENKDENHVIKELVGDDLLAGDPEAAAQRDGAVMRGPGGAGHQEGRGSHPIPVLQPLPHLQSAHVSPVLWGEKVQGPRLPLPAPFGLVGVQNLVKTGAAALRTDVTDVRAQDPGKEQARQGWGWGRKQVGRMRLGEGWGHTRGVAWRMVGLVGARDKVG